MSNVLAFVFWLSLGWAPDGIAPLYDTVLMPDQAHMLPLYTDLRAELVLLDTFFVYGDVLTNFNFGQGAGWPFSAYYAFGAGLRVGDWLEVGWKHTCLHPVLWTNYPVENARGGAYNEFYVRLRGKVVLF